MNAGLIKVASGLVPKLPNGTLLPTIGGADIEFSGITKRDGCFGSDATAYYYVLCEHVNSAFTIPGVGYVLEDDDITFTSTGGPSTIHFQWPSWSIAGPACSARFHFYRKARVNSWEGGGGGIGGSRCESPSWQQDRWCGVDVTLGYDIARGKLILTMSTFPEINIELINRRLVDATPSIAVMWFYGELDICEGVVPNYPTLTFDNMITSAPSTPVYNSFEPPVGSVARDWLSWIWPWDAVDNTKGDHPIGYYLTAGTGGSATVTLNCESNAPASSGENCATCTDATYCHYIWERTYNRGSDTWDSILLIGSVCITEDAVGVGYWRRVYMDEDICRWQYVKKQAICDSPTPGGIDLSDPPEEFADGCSEGSAVEPDPALPPLGGDCAFCENWNIVADVSLSGTTGVCNVNNRKGTGSADGSWADIAVNAVGGQEVGAVGDFENWDGDDCTAPAGTPAVPSFEHTVLGVSIQTAAGAHWEPAMGNNVALKLVADLTPGGGDCSGGCDKTWYGESDEFEVDYPTNPICCGYPEVITLHWVSEGGGAEPPTTYTGGTMTVRIKNCP